MARYQIILAYDGTDFLGFQRQADGRTVQGVIETALARLNWQGRSILAAGRTDTGVHARGQVVAVDLDWNHTPEDLMAALNANLPPDVAAYGVTEAREDFHPRFDAVARLYCYQIFCHPVRNPLLERYSWRVWPPVDLGSLNRAAANLLGEHDFSAFGKSPTPGGSTIRTVLEASWSTEKAGFFKFEIVANAFLYHMVRRLVKIQIAISQRKLNPAVILQMLADPDSQVIHGLAPPNGLSLESVRYLQ
jgi:tRNA pseudouridine38-40 synthase